MKQVSHGQGSTDPPTIRTHSEPNVYFLDLRELKVPRVIKRMCDKGLSPTGNEGADDAPIAPVTKS